MKKILILLIRFYQKFISPMFPAKCRFYPTCSQYTLEAIKEYGAIKGTYLGIKRILKCHPFHEGGYDPVPKRKKKFGGKKGRMSYIRQFLAFLLNTTDKYVGNFGISIIIVTIIIKILLLPLTLKQDKSMKEMKKLQPELEKIKQKYANDKQMLNIKTMELYREHKVNPLGGCLPILIQLPILWALFGVLRSGIIPKDSSFLWMRLADPDPFYILPVLNGAVSFLQQKLMGTSDNAQMKNMMYVFPIMMIVISYKMPSGLQIYWLTSSLIAVIQQYFIMKKGA